MSIGRAGIQVTKDSATSQAIATLSATSDTQYQVIGWSGSSSINSCAVSLEFGSTVKAKLLANSGVSVGEYYGEDGPVTATNEAVYVRTDNRKGGIGWCTANLIYRIVL